jgi:hypothetical protein
MGSSPSRDASPIRPAESIAVRRIGTPEDIGRGVELFVAPDAGWAAVRRSLSTEDIPSAATGRGDEVIAEAESHVVYYETGGMASLAGVMPRTIETDDGILTAERVAPNTGIERLAEDHDRARRLAALLEEVPGLSVN